MKANKLNFNYFLISALSFVFLLIGTRGYGQNMSYREVDANQDKKVDRMELKEAISMAGMLANWDTNQNGYFDDKEFYTFTYRLWDSNHDGTISEEEWKKGITHIENYNENQNGSFEDWDSDQNSKINFNEFTSGLKDNHYFRALDMNEDQKLSNQEVSNAVFKIWDEDDDDNIERIEFGEWTAILDQDDN